jgi:membrane-associated protease RseP (regulator of RpoE activity)
LASERPPFSDPPSGDPYNPVPDLPVELVSPGYYAPARPRRFQHRYWVHGLWLLATVVTTTLVGALHWLSFQMGFAGARVPMDLSVLLHGFWYSGTLLAILGAHEMGHYVMCRRHQVDATLPYFLPAPIPLTGTIGAFIKIREAFPSKAVLFDIGVGGPIAGFVVLVPALILGVHWSVIERVPPTFDGLQLGEPLLFKLASWMAWGPIPDAYSLNLHPMAFAAWFGLIATALNLLPFGQLDGGHIAYAVLGRRATLISYGTLILTLGLTVFSSSWAVVALMIVVMFLFLGARHPLVPDDHVPLDTARLWVAFAALVIFVLCFTPAPIETSRLISQP